MDWLIATDLDGTLLDDGYPLAEAARALDGLHDFLARQDPQARLHTVLASSKTCAELVPLANRCASAPLIVFENGAGWARRSPAWQASPAGCSGYQAEMLATLSYAEIRARLTRLRRPGKGFDFRGFGDWSAAEVAARTGLAEPDAQAAKQRAASEPIVWQGTPQALQAFTSELERNGLCLTQGGRFMHVAEPHSKGATLARIEAQHSAPGRPLLKVACGDAGNDLDMLRRADLALVFPNRDGGYILAQGAGVIHAPSAGPETWLACVTDLIESQYRQD